MSFYDMLMAKKMADNGGGGGGGFSPNSKQLAAMNSGIDSDKVGQIEVNKNDISDIQKEQIEQNTRLSILEDRPIVYGWHIDPNESDPSEAVTYLADAVGMTPAKMGTDSFDYGSWKNAFFMPKPCMLRCDGTVAYYLDPNDYSQKIDGTPSDVADPAFKGNAMMEWGLIWYKFAGGERDGEGFFYVSNRQVDDSYHCWCNYDSKDNITPHFYTAIYNGTYGAEVYSNEVTYEVGAFVNVDGIVYKCIEAITEPEEFNTKKWEIVQEKVRMRSLSNIMLKPDNGNAMTNVTKEVAMATANNTTDDIEWHTGVFADDQLITALLVLVSKSRDTQSCFGRGLVSGSQETKESYITGTLDSKGLFWGVTSAGTSAVKVFGMENYWGCTWRRVAGCISVEHTLKIKLTYGTADGSETIGYDETGAGYIDKGSVPQERGYAGKMNFDKYGYMTSAVNGSSTTYYCDYFHESAGTRHLTIGAHTNVSSSEQGGAFCFALYFEHSRQNGNISAALSCKPLANKEA